MITLVQQCFKTQKTKYSNGKYDNSRTGFK